MKITLEGTEAELINVLHSFGIPNEVVFDDGKQFLCGDMCGRGHRRKKAETDLSDSTIYSAIHQSALIDHLEVLDKLV